MRRDGELGKTAQEELQERYDALVREARGLEELLKLCRLADRKAKLDPRNGRLSPDALEARMLLIASGINQEEAAHAIGKARGTMARKLNGYIRLYPDEMAKLRELARKGRKA